MLFVLLSFLLNDRFTFSLAARPQHSARKPPWFSLPCYAQVPERVSILTAERDHRNGPVPPCRPIICSYGYGSRIEVNRPAPMCANSMVQRVFTMTLAAMDHASRLMKDYYHLVEQSCIHHLAACVIAIQRGSHLPHLALAPFASDPASRARNGFDLMMCTDTPK